MIAHQHLSCRRLEDGNDADRLLLSTDSIPGDPDAVRRSEIRDTEVLRKLFWSENIFPLRFVGLTFVIVIEGVDNQFAFSGNGLMSLIVKVDASAESACRLIIRAVNDRFAPNGNQFGGLVSSRFQRISFFSREPF